MKRKSKEPVEVSAKRIIQENIVDMPNLRSVIKSVQRRSVKKTKTRIGTLPNELLCKIFEYLDVQTLYYHVRLVCKRWCLVAMSPILWTKIQVKNDIPTQILTKWIECSGLLRELSMENRNDANLMTEIVLRFI